MKDPKELRKKWKAHYQRWSGEPETDSITPEFCSGFTCDNCPLDWPGGVCAGNGLLGRFWNSTGPERTRLAREIRDLPLKEKYRKVFPYVVGDEVRDMDDGRVGTVVITGKPRLSVFVRGDMYFHRRRKPRKKFTPARLVEETEEKEEPKMEYKALKEITPAALWEAQGDKDCGEFRGNWDGMLDRFGCSSLTAELPFADFIKWAESRPGGLIDWLLGKSFIWRMEEQTFEVGQCFETPGGVYALASTKDGFAVLTRVCDRWGDNFSVANFHAVKSSEIPNFKQLKPVHGRFVYEPEAK